MHLLTSLVLVATFVLPNLADDDDAAISATDIPTICLVLCAPVIQQADNCALVAAAAAPSDDDKRWLPPIFLFRRDDDDVPTTADPCICNNATFAVKTVAPPCDDCIQANGATTTAVNDLIENCKLPAAVGTAPLTVTVTAGTTAAGATVASAAGPAAIVKGSAGSGIASSSAAKNSFVKRSDPGSQETFRGLGYAVVATLIVAGVSVM